MAQVRQSATGTDKALISALYEHLLDAWNRHNAQDYAALITDDGNLVGFDGSQINGRKAIEAEITRIFADHVTAAYVGKVREVRFLTSDVAILRAVVGMVPPGQNSINPATNAIQSMIAVRKNDLWQIALFHNTPAQFHGRPELGKALTAELQQLV